MTLLDALAWASNLGVLATYFLLAATGRTRPFHWANALGCWPLMAVEIHVQAWQPLVLTGFFGAIGIAGLIRGEK